MCIFSDCKHSGDDNGYCYDCMYNSDREDNYEPVETTEPNEGIDAWIKEDIDE